MHETQAVEIKAEMPRNLRNKSAMEIVEYMRVHFNSDFVYDDKGHVTGEEPKNKATAYLMACADALLDPADYRNPFKAWFPKCGHEWAKAVVIWYHGAEPHDNGYWICSLGYACW